MLKICTVSKFAVVAQPVEQLTRNEQVVRSIRINGSRKKKVLSIDKTFFLSGAHKTLFHK